MRVADFDFELPPERIAQAPLERRDASRLMVLARPGGEVEHRQFGELPRLLEPGDLLVLNDTRVLPARLIGRKLTGGRVELLLLERIGEDEAGPLWQALIRCARAPRTGSLLRFADDLDARVVERKEERWIVRLEAAAGRPEEALERVGRTPLPPYIERSDDGAGPVDDRERYQTVFARRPGAVAAPTAGLHFTRELLERVEARGVECCRLTLHVGLGTFQPVRTERVEEHALHEEWFEVPDSVAAAVGRTRARGGRVVAVGTTVVRALEWCATDEGQVSPGRGRCSLFVYPGFRFRAVDAMVTNFHLPRSTLLMLVAAFVGREELLAAYRVAVEKSYRFYSYGDAMFVRPS